MTTVRPWVRFLGELFLIVGLFFVYKLGRRAAIGHEDAAFANAHRVWDLERALRLPDEASVQRLVLHSETLVRAINYFYATVHFPAIVVFLLWIYFWRNEHYRWIRNAIIGMTGAGLVLHVLVPLAPPRMLQGVGLIDTGNVYGPRVYQSPQADGVNNQFAAMPSLHVGWALLIAVGLIAATRARWRWLWLLHPAVTTFVVVATANHYWLDGIVGCALLGLAMLLPPVRKARNSQKQEPRALNRDLVAAAAPRAAEPEEDQAQAEHR